MAGTPNLTIHGFTILETSWDTINVEQTVYYPSLETFELG